MAGPYAGGGLYVHSSEADSGVRGAIGDSFGNAVGATMTAFGNVGHGIAHLANGTAGETRESTVFAAPGRHGGGPDSQLSTMNPRWASGHPYVRQDDIYAQRLAYPTYAAMSGPPAPRAPSSYRQEVQDDFNYNPVSRSAAEYPRQYPRQYPQPYAEEPIEQPYTRSSGSHLDQLDGSSRWRDIDRDLDAIEASQRARYTRRSQAAMERAPPHVPLRDETGRSLVAPTSAGYDHQKYRIPSRQAEAWAAYANQAREMASRASVASQDAEMGAVAPTVKTSAPVAKSVAPKAAAPVSKSAAPAATKSVSSADDLIRRHMARVAPRKA